MYVSQSEVLVGATHTPICSVKKTLFVKEVINIVQILVNDIFPQCSTLHRSYIHTYTHTNLILQETFVIFEL